MNCDTLATLIKNSTEYLDKYIIKEEDFKERIGDNPFTNEKCPNIWGKPILVQKEKGPVLAIKAALSNNWVKQTNPNGISLDSEGGRKSRRHKRKTLKRKTKRRRYKHRRSRRTRR
jgi:hypothetical protein